MQQTDVVILRMIAGTLCVCALILVGVVGWSSLGDFEVDQVLDRLSFLLLGGLLTAFSTKFTGKEPVEVAAPAGQPVEVAPVEDGPLD